MNRLLVVTVFFLALSSSACIYVSGSGDGPGERTTRTSKTAPFTSVSIDRSFDFVDIAICEDCDPEIEITGGDRDVNDVMVDVHEGLLELSGDRSLSVHSTDLVATIRTKDLSSITVTSSADVSVLGIAADRFEIVSTGSGDVTAKGDARSVDITASGSGDVNAFDLDASDVDLTSTGSGDVQVCAHDSISARLTGSGNLTYDCGATDRDITATGSGDVGVR